MFFKTTWISNGTSGPQGIQTKEMALWSKDRFDGNATFYIRPLDLRTTTKGHTSKLYWSGQDK